MTDAMSHKPSTESGFDIKKFLFMLVSNWYWFAISLMITLAVAYLLNRYTEPLFQVSTTIMIQRSDNTSSGVDNLIEELGLTRRRRQTEIVNEIEILKSFQLSYNTLKQLADFDVTYTAVGDIKDAKLYNSSPFIVVLDSLGINSSGYPVHVTVLNDREYLLEIDKVFGIKKKMLFGEPFHHPKFNFTLVLRDEYYRNMFSSKKPFQSKYYFVINDLYSMANSYRRKLDISLTNEKGRTIMVRCTGYNVDQEVDFLNKIAEVYIQNELNEKNRTAENAIRFIDQQLDLMVDSISRDERKIENFKRENLGIELSEKGKELYEQFKKYQEQIVEMMLRINYFDYLLSVLQKPDQDEVLPVITGLLEDKVNEGITKVNELILKKRVLQFNSRQNSPDYRILEQEIDNSRELLKNSLSTSKKYTQNLISDQQSKIAWLENELRGLPSKEREYLNIQRKYKLNDNLYTFLLQKRAEAGIVKASNVAGNQVLDKARTNAVVMISPRTGNNYTIGLLIGFLLPLAIILLLDFFNTRIITRGDVEALTRVPIIGAVGHNKKPTQVPVYEYPKSVIAESFRLLRTNLQYLLREPGEKVIMVTSTVSGEGKTFCSVNLSAIIAMSDKKTLLISIDLRKPKIHNTFNLSNTIGLSSFLIGKSSLEDIIFPTQVNNLYIVPSGPIPPNPAELLETQKMLEFFKAVKDQFDFIVFDTPPIAVVPDALTISRFADTTIFVVRQRFSHRDTVRLVNDLDIGRKLNRINILINDVERSGGYGYGYGYGYAYGYAYGYGYRSGEHGYGTGYYDEEPRETGFRGWLKRRLGMR